MNSRGPSSAKSVSSITSRLHDTLDLAASRQRLRDELVERVDDEGGFGDAPKFRDRATSRRCSSSTTTRRASRSNGPWTRCRDEGSTTISRGFARYSVDAECTCRTLKDAQRPGTVGAAYLRAARSMPEHAEWREVALDTINFVLSDLAVESGFARPWTPTRRARRFTRDLDPKEVADALEETAP